MSKYRYLNTRFWSDSWTVDDLNPLDRYLMLYLLTNEKTNLSGVYELPMRIISNETGIEKEELARMIKRLEPKVFYRKGWVVLVNAIKHQSYKNPKIATAIQKELCQSSADLIELLVLPQDFSLDFSCPIDSKAIAYPYPMHDVSHVIKSNVIKSNVIKSKSDKPTGFNKKYFKAAEADRKQEVRINKNADRVKQPGYKSFATVGEAIKSRQETK